MRDVVPKHKVLEILDRVHSVGHFKSGKLYHTLKLNYFWHGMSADIEAFCRKCEICETLVKPTNQFVLEHAVANEPFEILSMDLVELTTGIYNFLLTLMDVYSRFAVAVPIRNKTSEVVMRAFLDSMVGVFLCSG